MRAHESRHAVARGQNDFLNSVSPPGCIASTCGLQLPDGLTDAQWEEIGHKIVGVRSATGWWLGDWWAGGAHRYGDRRTLVESDAWDGPGLQACMDRASVSRAFPTSRRREVLTFAHHREVAGLPPDEADALLDWAEEPAAQGNRPRSIRALRQERNRRSQQCLPPMVDVQGIAEGIDAPQPRVEPAMVHGVAGSMGAELPYAGERAVVTTSSRRVIPSAFGVATWPPIAAGGSVSRGDHGLADDAQLAALLRQLGALATMDASALSAAIGQPQRVAYIDIALRARQQIDHLIESLQQ